MSWRVMVADNIFAPERGTVDPEVVKIVMHEVRPTNTPAAKADAGSENELSCCR